MTSSEFILYEAPASSCSFRIRIALNLKGISYESRVHTNRRTPEYQKINPQALVPFLVHNEIKLGQSIAILEYLEEAVKGGGHPLLPASYPQRGRARSVAQYIVSEVQVLQNTRLIPYLQSVGVDDFAFRQYWVKYGLTELEKQLAGPESGDFCVGSSPTVADICLVPQVWNALHVYQVQIEAFPKVKDIYERCLELPAFSKALPENQPSYPKT